jgi:hypothetical protein
MIPAIRRLGSFVIALCLAALAQAQQSATTPLSAEDVAALQRVAEEFYTAYTQEDMARFIGLWSRQSPEREAARTRMQQQFDSYEQIAVQRLEVRRAERTGERAKLLLAIETSAIDAKTKQPASGFGKVLRVMECVKEDGAWRVWRFASATDDLAASLVGLKTDEERGRALAEAEPELLNTDLTKAVAGAAERLRAQGEMAQALAVLRFMERWAEQRKDRAGLAPTYNAIGIVFAVQGSFVSAIEYFQKAADTFAASVD